MDNTCRRFATTAFASVFPLGLASQASACRRLRDWNWTLSLLRDHGTGLYLFCGTRVLGLTPVVASRL